MTITVVVAEDEALVRAGCVMLLNAAPDIEVLGQAGNGAEVVELAHSLRPDVVLVDLRIPGMDGIAATSAITGPRAAEGTPPPKVLVLTTFNEETAVQQALAAGARGFLLKHAAPADLITAIRHCAAGEGWLDPSVIGGVIGAIPSPPAALASVERPNSPEVRTQWTCPPQAAAVRS